MIAIPVTPKLAPVYVVDGRRVHVSSLDETCRLIVERRRPDRSFYICTLNLDHLVKLRSNEAFRGIYAGAELVTADGFPIVLLAGLDGVRIQRVTGADLVQPLCAAAALRRLSVYLLGPTEKTLELCLARLKQDYPTLHIAGAAVAPPNLDPRGAEARNIIDDISRSGAGICFIGLGAPKQEFLAAFGAEQVKGIAFIPVGAALEFLAGAKMRAPRPLRSLGLEWLWRLLSEPRRLSRRYFASAVLFIELLVRRGQLAAARRVGEERAPSKEAP